MSAFVISLDFELFWGVSDVRTIRDYGANVLGVRDALPRMLQLFRSRAIHATWATVGMLMCADDREWNTIRPRVMPGYQDQRLSSYRLVELTKAHPRLFFARDLVNRIVDTPGQEIATHTYSHFYCNEAGATPPQFEADLDCAIELARSLHTLNLLNAQEQFAGWIGAKDGLRFARSGHDHVRLRRRRRYHLGRCRQRHR